MNECTPSQILICDTGGFYWSPIVMKQHGDTIIRGFPRLPHIFDLTKQ